MILRRLADGICSQNWFMREPVGNLEANVKKEETMAFNYIRHGFSIVLMLGIAALMTGIVPTAQAGVDLAKWEITNSSKIRISNVTIIDAVNGVRHGYDVVVEDGRIVDVVSHSESVLLASEEIIDGSSLYAIPGLWDAHAHLTFDKEIGVSALPMFLANGITSVRDTGGLLHKVLPMKQTASDMWHQAEPHAPRVFVAGPLLDGVPVVYNGEIPSFPEIGTGINTVEAARDRVDAFKEAGVDFVKVYEMLAPDVFQAILERAEHHGLPVASHMPLRVAPYDFADPRVGSLEHMRNMEVACGINADQFLQERRETIADQQDRPGRELRSELHKAHRIPSINSEEPARCDAFLAAMIEAGIIHNPTLALNTWSTGRHVLSDEWIETFAHLPDAVRERWTTTVMGAREQMQTRPDQVTFSEWSKDMVQRINHMDGNIMAGTDMPIAFLTPGFSLHLELQVLVDAGLTPLEALEAATMTPAKFFGIENDFGSVSIGKVADIVLLSADPSIDIAATRQISGVMAAGRYLNHHALQDLLENAKDQ